MATAKKSRLQSESLVLRFYPGEIARLKEFIQSSGLGNLSEWARATLRKAAGLQTPSIKRETKGHVAKVVPKAKRRGSTKTT
jgi:hypothetical protein